MERLREKIIEEYLEGMERYIEKIKLMTKEETTQLLIRGGVLDENGNPKEQICNGGMYCGNR